MSSKIISPDDIKHIAKLANLPITEQEAEALSPQLSEITNYVKNLQKLDLKNTLVTSQVTGLKNVFREDEVKPSLTQEEALSNAQNTYEGYVVVPAVINKNK